MSNIVTGLQPLTVELTRLESMKNNPRRGDVEAVMKSYEKFGQRKPIVARVTGRDKADQPVGEVIAGNHQLMAAREMGWTEIAVVWVEDDDATAAAYAIADNRIGQLGEWDVETLLDSLDDLDDDLLAATGFDLDDIDDFAALLEETSTGSTQHVGSVEASNATAKVDVDTNVKADLSYNEFLERYAARATRNILLEYPLAEFDWINAQLLEYRTANGLESSSAAVMKLLSDATGATPPEPTEA